MQGLFKAIQPVYLVNLGDRFGGYMANSWTSVLKYNLYLQHDQKELKAVFSASPLFKDSVKLNTWQIFHDYHAYHAYCSREFIDLNGRYLGNRLLCRHFFLHVFFWFKTQTSIKQQATVPWFIWLWKKPCKAIAGEIYPAPLGKLSLIHCYGWNVAWRSSKLCSMLKLQSSTSLMFELCYQMAAYPPLRTARTLRGLCEVIKALLGGEVEIHNCW